MKKIALLTAAILLTAAVHPFPHAAATAYAEDESAGYTEAKNKDYSYRIYEDHVTITNIERSGGDMVIPAEIDGLPVTDWDPEASIPGFYAFTLTVDENNPYFETIGDALICKTSQVLILYTGSNEGYDSYNEIWLENYQIPEGVKVIGKQAFRKGKFIHSIQIPDSVVSLKESSLQGTSLEEITIPETVTEIGDAALNTNKLKTITLSGNNPSYQLIDGVLFTKDGKTLCCYPQEKEDERYDVPEGTETFMEYCFLNCRHVTEIGIPASFTGSLRPSEHIQNLTAYDIADDHPLYSDIDGVVFDPAGETLIKYPIQYCKDGVYYVPDGVKSIADYALYGAKFFGIVFPESVELLNRYCMFGTQYRHLKFVKILNPKCEIKPVSLEFGLGVDPASSNNVSIGTVFGYAGSTAQTFARRADYAFNALRSQPGDLNTDGVSDIRDVKMLQNWLLTAPDDMPFSLNTADMNADGQLTATDLSLLKTEILQAVSCTLTWQTDDHEPQQMTVYEGDMLYELQGGTIAKNLSPFDACAGKIITVSKITDSSVSYTDFARNHHILNLTAKYGEAFSKDSLLMGYGNFNYTFTLQFDPADQN